MAFNTVVLPLLKLDHKGITTVTWYVSKYLYLGWELLVEEDIRSVTNENVDVELHLSLTTYPN